MSEIAFVFIAMFCLDFVWARYVQAIAKSAVGEASALSAVIVGLNGIVTLAYVKDHWMLVPTALGAFAGTYAAIWWGKRKEKVITELNLSST